MLKLKTYSGFHELFLNLASILQDIFENTSYLLFYIYTIFLHGIAGSVLVKKILPQKRTTHNYVLSVQDWCYNTATLNVTIVTENTVSMNQGNTEAHGGQKRVVHTKFDIYVCFYYFHCIDTSACGLLVPECITSTIVGIY